MNTEEIAKEINEAITNILKPISEDIYTQLCLISNLYRQFGLDAEQFKKLEKDTRQIVKEQMNEKGI